MNKRVKLDLNVDSAIVIRTWIQVKYMKKGTYRAVSPFYTQWKCMRVVMKNMSLPNNGLNNWKCSAPCSSLPFLHDSYPVRTEQLPLTLVTTLSHALSSLLSINPDALKLNVAQELKACHVKMPLMVSSTLMQIIKHLHSLLTVIIPVLMKYAICWEFCGLVSY